MKIKIIFRQLCVFIAFLFLSSTLFSQKNLKKQFVLQGKIAGTVTGWVYLEYLNSVKLYVTDSNYLKSGEFKFSGFIDEPTMAIFYIKSKPRSVDDANITDIVLESAAMQVYYKVEDLKNGIVSGSKSHIEYKLYYDRRIGVGTKWRKMFDALDNARNNHDTATANNILEQQYPLYEEDAKAVDVNYIKEFPNSYTSAFVLTTLSHKLPMDSLKILYSILSPAVQQSVNGKTVIDFIENTEKLAIGMPAPDFMIADMNGKNISLKDFKGKYVLLEFWASWCSPCRKENPNLKKAYSRFHDKGFEIIGISLDLPDFKKAWLEAIKADSLPWIQLSLNRAVIKEYNVQRIPASFLIAPDGKILSKDLRGEEVEKKLAELIK